MNNKKLNYIITLKMGSKQSIPNSTNNRPQTQLERYIDRYISDNSRQNIPFALLQNTNNSNQPIMKVSGALYPPPPPPDSQTYIVAERL